MAKIVANIVTKPGITVTIISEENTMKEAVDEVKEAIRAFGKEPELGNGIYKVRKVDN